MAPIYLLHPLPTSLPGIDDWVEEVRALLQGDKNWDGWPLFVSNYDKQGSFPVQPLFVRVLQKLGPVVLLEKVQGKALRLLRERLHTRSVILVQAAGESTDIWAALVEARRRFESGEPFLPRKLVVAILIVRKLRKGHYWGGKSKGYLWGDDIAKGRGVDDRFADIAAEVTNDLLQHEILISKVSQGSKKYALNPAKKPEVHDLANHGMFWNDHLKKVLERDRQMESAYLLEDPRTARSFQVTPQGAGPFECQTVTDMISWMRDCPDVSRYEVEVRFEQDHVLHEVITSRSILLQFFEAFLP